MFYLLSSLEEKAVYTELEKDLAHFTRALDTPVGRWQPGQQRAPDDLVRNEIIEVPQLSQATVLQHLRELKRAGLLQGRIFGAKADYKIDIENLRKFDERFHSFMSHFQNT